MQNVMVECPFSMHKYSCQSVSEHVHIIVIIIGYKSGDFYLKEYHIVYTIQKSNIGPIVFDIDSMNGYVYYIYCTPLISPNPTHENIILYQLKPFKCIFIKKK